ncbi:MAG: cell division protein FtsQ [Oleiphilaceae bacterium]|jgi:cell division protein FtsQ
MNNEAKAKVSSRGASVVMSSERDYRALAEEFAPLLGSLKRVLFVLVVLTILLTIMSQKQWFLQLIDHEITTINVKGALASVTPAHIEQALPALIGSSFLMSDLDGIKSKIEALPWVDYATVSRVWPSGIELQIEEQIAVSYWNGSAFINKNGVIFQPDYVDKNLGLPVLLGASDKSPEVRIEMLAVLTDLQGLLSEYKLGVIELALKPRGVWDILLDNGISVALGAQPLEDKVNRLGAIFTQGSGIDLGAIKRIDARYPNGVAVEWKEQIMLAGSGRTK